MRYRRIWGSTLVMVVAAATMGGSAHAAEPEDKCAAAKLKTVGAYFACRQKADAKATLKDLAADYGKCSSTFVDKWDKAEEKGGGTCPDDTTGTAMGTFLDEHANLAAAIVSGAYVPPGCGDGEVNVVGEQCDAPDFNATTCASLGHGGGALTCTAGCRFDTAGCSVCPDGTIEYKGACWALGGAGPAGPVTESCDAACASLGLTCDEPALALVADDGTDAECGEIMDLLNIAGAPHTTQSFNLAGCGSPENNATGCVITPSVVDSIRVLHSTAPKCSAAQEPSSPALPNCVLGPVGQRACACK